MTKAEPTLGLADTTANLPLSFHGVTAGEIEKTSWCAKVQARIRAIEM